MLLPSVIGIDKAACSIEIWRIKAREFVACVLASIAIDTQATMVSTEIKRKSLWRSCWYYQT